LEKLNWRAPFPQVTPDLDTPLVATGPIGPPDAAEPEPGDDPDAEEEAPPAEAPAPPPGEAGLVTELDSALPAALAPALLWLPAVAETPLVPWDDAELLVFLEGISTITNSAASRTAPTGNALISSRAR
jgi:hypothetical protein